MKFKKERKTALLFFPIYRKICLNMIYLCFGRILELQTRFINYNINTYLFSQAGLYYNQSGEKYILYRNRGFL